ncbi:hypothetical protein JRO89_XS10G0183100 [Xanthoceras sorbifolium]|uniref:DDT domain-containing protein PTM-like n=1 Tax=Xanthoceras sorbifolium TaxID=99658 RepID=A0ABQ8HJB0_9ROSI|nr:hypothetical protein JRO89_XS10G0183100 [Xanthoceras sorbifolium]
METKVKRPRGRPRKRKTPEDEDVTADTKSDSAQDKRRAVVVEMKPIPLVGRYVLKEFEGSGIYLGKIVYYDSGLYRVDYEDGDCEDLDSRELRNFLLDENHFDNDLRRRRKKLDDKVLKKGVTCNNNLEKRDGDSKSEVHCVELPTLSELSGGLTVEDDVEQVEGDVDSSSDSCEHVRGTDVGWDVEASLLPPLQLPPSSGTICVPEEYVSHLFSVYGFLRSFGIRIFLSPFGLDDFVGSLNCCVPNTLLDAIHVALMRVLRRHLEALSSDGSERASKCLRCIDWSLLDTLTWPVYLVQYLTLMGYIKGPEWKGFYNEVLEREYYSLTAGRKLIILQILCDDVLESEELRAEIDMREESEVGIDPDANASESGPRRVHPRYSKTSACKNREDVEISAESDVMKSSRKAKHLGFKGIHGDADTPNVGGDGNGDECRICGMEGTLLCCDGCPSAYHTRCIGVTKMYIPEGSWYCPECTINKMGPAITLGTTLRGAELFGIDLYEQVFLGTCNHLLVLNASNNTESYYRYYNAYDIPKVLRVLLSSTQHVSLYSGICKSILHYWGIPESLFSLEMTEMGINLTNLKADEKLSGLSIHPPVKESHKVANMVQTANASSNNEKNVDSVTVSCLNTSADTKIQNVLAVAAKSNGVTMTEKIMDSHVLNMKPPGKIKMESGLSTAGSASLPADPSDVSNQSFVDRSSEKLPGQIKMEFGMSTGSARLPADPSDVTHQILVDRVSAKLSGQIKMISGVSIGSASLQADPSDITHQSLVDRSSAIDLLTCTSGTSKDSFSGHASSQSKEGNHAVFGRILRNPADNCVYMGSLFKPQAYINQYMHGDFAASAAANLAVVSSEESHVSEAHKLGSARKVMSGNIPLQAKAFSLTASRFFWPCSEKKLWEVPRERCSWCHSCKAPVASKRACMLNSAVIIATKSAMKILNGLHPPKIGEGSLATIVTYILIMEEGLRGLIGGPFVSASYRKKWRKQVEEASTFNSIKDLLLELEENTCLIVLSGEWVKPMDNLLGESSVIESASCNVGTTQKRGPGGKRGRKPFVMSEVSADVENDQSFSWWQGGKISKRIFQKAILPCSMVRKAARQGGKRRIFGVNYADGSEIPKRSRQLVWRAAVERSKNASQLALQVRYVDLHVRWSDLVRPEQTFQDGKGPETEASAFRNAIICDKKIVENKIRYGIVFGNQKHLPSRVMKNIIEIEQGQDGKAKYWFLETRIPLYLIKEYGENVDKEILPSVKKPLNELSELQKKQLKASRNDIFSYLVCKRDKLEKCACASCHLDVLLGNSVKCSACQGFCHEGCTLSSVYNNRVERLITCKLCYNGKVLAPSQIRSESQITPLPSRRQEYHTAPPIAKGMRPKGLSQPSASVRNQETCSGTKQNISGSSSVMKARSRTLSWGIIWKKKNTEDTGVDFRRANILLRGSDVHHLEPVCDLCQQLYNSDLMYIHCENCKRWFHAEAVELEESKLSDVVGFKCCKCRRIGGPECPYMDPEQREQKRKKRHMRAQKQGQGTIRVDSDCGTKSGSECKPTTPLFPTEDVFVPEDPLLFSRSRVELITERNSETEFEWNSASGPGPQKLPVRRHVKCEEDVGDFVGNSLSHVDMQFEKNNVINPDEPLVPCVEWDAFANGHDGDMLFDYEGLSYEDMEFEPQTYFSLSELLASDDGGQLDGVDASGFVSGSREDLSCSVAQDVIPDQFKMATYNNQLERTVSTDNTMHCRICQDMELAPDLSCQICGLWIHGRCSPWDESCQMEGSWRCGNCREWR